MAKKLLSLDFKTLDKTKGYNIGCNSSDNIPANLRDIVNDSDTQPLGQVGALIFPDNNSTNTVSKYKRLNTIMAVNMGYGARVVVPTSLSDELGTSKYYLNGEEFDENGNPMPYITFNPNNYWQLVYYKGDGTFLGPVFNIVPGGPVEGSNAPSLILGKLYDDGTFTGDYGGVSEYENGNYRRYVWGVTTHVENTKIMYDAVINDIQNYLPIEPEGEFTDSGEGDFDASSDNIDYPNLPNKSVVDCGMCAIYQMSSAQLKVLSQYLWSNDITNTIYKMFNNPMEAIINVCMCPLDFTGQSTEANVKLGNVVVGATGLALNTTYKIIDFGTINLHEYWGDFADYSPYTKLSIYLPYTSGVHPISIDDVMRGSITLKGYCDVSTGSIIYMLYSSQSNPRYHGHQSVLYSWSGNIMYQIPLSSSDFSQVISSVIGAAGTLAGAAAATVATSGSMAPIAVGAAVGTIGNAMNAKTHIERGGSVGGAVGLFGIQYPYLILERPEIISPTEYPHLIGVPDSTENFLSNISGYVTVKGCDLEIERATENEVAQIETLLKGGVYI